MKHNHQRWIAAAMSLALTLACVEPAFAAAPSVPVGDGRTPSCDEAYYATLDYYGNLTEGSIVKSYVLNGATSITDYGEYESVSNLTNGVTPTQEAKRVAFDFAGADETPTHFYFQGKTAQPYKDLPWKLSVSYKLNGVPAKAEDLAGKTGVVEINVDAIPNKNVGDYARHNYTLETMALFNQDDILSLEAPGAQVQLLGNLRAVLFVAFPGEEGHYTIRVGADKFEFGGMTFLMVPATLSQLDQISKLAQRKEDLEDNYAKLSGSLDTLLDSLDAVSGSLYSSASGLDALNAARGTVSSGKGKVYASADQALDSADVMLGEMSATTAALRTDLNTLNAILADAQGSKDDLLAVMTDMARLQTKLNYAANGLNSLGGANAGVSAQQLGSAKTIYDAFVNATPEKSVNGSMDEAQFMAVALKTAGKDENTIKLLTSASSAEEAGQSAYHAAHEVACSTAYPVAYNAAYIAAYKAVLDSQNLGALYEGDASQTADAFRSAMEGKLDYLASAGKLSAEQAAQLKAAADAKAQEVGESKGKEIAEQKAAEIANAKKQEAEAGYAALDAAFQAGVAGNQNAKTGALDFAGFLTALAAASSDATQRESINKLLALYREDPETVAEMIANPNQLSALNQDLGSMNAAMHKAGMTGAAASTLISSLSEVCGDIAALRPLVEDADDLTTLARTDAEKIDATLASVEKAQQALDGYQPELDSAAAEVQSLAAASADANAFLRSAEDLLQTAGAQFDDATRQSLSSLAAALRGTAAALGESSGVRDAKASINEVVEDTWNDYTGDVSDLLEMDASAEAVSLTDPRNPSPASVQVLIRTQEIKAEETKAGAKTAAVAEDAAESSFFTRVGDMFANMWSAIVGLFRH
ncbi:MAG: hypothetical protein E7422_06275 [Ruminococcaceae bacterium]|nr:hypothetical protein [Oscillospiraceae bacterium]